MHKPKLNWKSKLLLLALMVTVPAYGQEVIVTSDTPSSVYGNGIAPGYHTADTSLGTSGHSLTIEDGVTTGDDVIGCYYSTSVGDVTATGNKVIMNGKYVEGLLLGAHPITRNGNAAIIDNEVIVNDGDLFNVSGGEAEAHNGVAIATGNSVTFNNGKAYEVTGANTNGQHGSKTTVTNNRVTINNGDISVSISGGNATGELETVCSDNSVTINGGKIDGYVFGGCAFGWSEITAKNNHVIITGGSFSDIVLGGYAWYLGKSDPVASLTDNVVDISGNPTFTDDVYLFGGLFENKNDVDLSNVDMFTGNTLNFSTKGIVVGGVANFEFLNFFLPEDAAAGDTLLTAATKADIGNSVITVGIAGTAPVLVEGDKIIVLSADELVGTPKELKAEQGVTLNYRMEVSQVKNEIILNIAKKPGQPDTSNPDDDNINTDVSDKDESDYNPAITVNPRAKSLSEAAITELALVNQGLDLVSSQNFDELTGRHVFFNSNGGSTRYHTGSHVDLKSVHITSGICNAEEKGKYSEEFGAFLEYGHGHYRTDNHFNDAAPVHGKGTLRQIGGGILGRLNFNEHESNEWYLKGSLHTGQIKNQYDSRDLRDLAGTVASYDKSSWYLGGHAELGTTWELSDKTKLGLGGKFLFSVIESGTVHLATGDPIDFRHMISERGQLAFSAQHKISDRVIPYARLSAEYEWKGEALATTHGYSLPAPSLHGASAGIELGIIAEPTEKMPLSIQTGIVGLYGKKEGYLGQLKIKYTL